MANNLDSILKRWRPIMVSMGFIEDDIYFMSVYCDHYSRNMQHRNSFKILNLLPMILKILLKLDRSDVTLHLNPELTPTHSECYNYTNEQTLSILLPIIYEKISNEIKGFQHIEFNYFINDIIDLHDDNLLFKFDYKIY